MPIALSYVGTVVALMVVFLAFVAIANYAIAEIAPQFYARLGDFRSLYNGCASRARDNGPPIDQTVVGFERLLGLARAFLSKLYTVLSYLGLITVIVILGLPVVRALVYKFRKQFERSENREIS